ncbi:aspartyl/asparaginyl beta-hydroxylase domain-containing protein [Sphingomonas qomolangmaensis]|uniref:Aspartyl/asparaginyl beta-hydroxylase domain-containing protein n=1 Tax=Sphingomonas qomolangmaensis TaxID=2918765 RepID=A0ABY5L592_9SPHN|nr:aspartyl/asparaginyl beta-hydroxylase domain-containing protein [Sphingomonas qomolangmaensis]UUL81233.1 aspartyl/asparaginyl beta-hydroxylase domain-containing protein [Sphingomonas qomolangmaensis]
MQQRNVLDNVGAAIGLARARDLDGARAMLGRLGASADRATALAFVERQAGNLAAERAALIEALRHEPRHLSALLARGDCERRAGEPRVAVRFLRTALAVAAATPPPPALHPALREAQAFLAEQTQHFTDTMVAAVEAAGLTRADTPPRVAEAIDLLLGRRQLYLEQPSMFYFPGLAQRAFFDRSEFAWASQVEAATDAIRDELTALQDVFTPYVRADPRAPAPANHLLEHPGWGAIHLIEQGRPHPVHAARCPATMAALAFAPQPAIGTRSPMALFSRLKPGTHIAPHHGVFNTRLICHLPLVVPDGCGIRVGSHTRQWREGELLILDDSFEHEAWNRGSSDRVVLLFEIWRPDIGEEERAAITVLLAAVEEQGFAADDD